jgi:hypothetical protein
MDFQSTLNPNEINPGASFQSAFQSGLGAAVQLHGQNLQNQLGMAQLGESSREFDLMQQLRQKELALNQQHTMADIGLIGAQTDLESTQVGQQQFALQQLPKMAANKAAIAQWQATPDAQDPANAESNLMKLRSQLPYPEAMGDQEWEQTANTIQGQQLKTTASLNFQAAHNKNLQVLSDAPTLLGDQGTKSFMTNPKGDPTDPTNYNMAALSQATLQKQVEMSRAGQQFQTQQKIAEIQEQGAQRLQYAQQLTEGRSTNAWERAMSQHYTSAYNNYTNLVKAGATDAELLAAKSELDRWSGTIDEYKQSTGGGSTAPSAPAGTPQGAAPSVGQPTGNAQTNPAQALWQQSIGK